MRKAKLTRLWLSVLDAVALETGKMQKDIQHLEFFNAIIVEIAGTGFQSSIVLAHLAKGNPLRKAFNSMKVKYSYR
jgi:hypothetical protein